MTRFILLGAGGHAKALVEILTARGDTVDIYVDPKQCGWLDARHVVDESTVGPGDGSLVIGVGAVTPADLRRRLEMLDRHLSRSFVAAPVVHPAAYVSPGAVLEPGVVVLAGAIIQPGAAVGRGAIVNTGAMVEHDTTIGAGCHIAPGAIVLGDCDIGCCCMIGAGAVILQSCSTPPDTLVPALTRIGKRYARHDSSSG